MCCYGYSVVMENDVDFKMTYKFSNHGSAINNISTDNVFNDNVYSNDTINDSDEINVFLMLLDNSKIVVITIGIITNIGTSITLIKNGQVCIGCTCLYEIT